MTDEKPIYYPSERPDTWRSTAADRPEPNTWIIILDDNDRVYKGYMRKFYFPNHTEPTFSFHGEGYDYQRDRDNSVRGRYVYFLVNAVAWMPMPRSPDKWIKAEKPAEPVTQKGHEPYAQHSPSECDDPTCSHS